MPKIFSTPASPHSTTPNPIDVMAELSMPRTNSMVLAINSCASCWIRWSILSGVWRWVCRRQRVTSTLLSRSDHLIDKAWSKKSFTAPLNARNSTMAAFSPANIHRAFTSAFCMEVYSPLVMKVPNTFRRTSVSSSTSISATSSTIRRLLLRSRQGASTWRNCRPKRVKPTASTMIISAAATPPKVFRSHNGVE